MRLPVASLIASVAAVSVIGFGGAPAAAAEPRPVIEDVQVFDAPIGKKGGIMTPYVGCSNWRVEPRARVVMSALDSDWRRVYEWRGAYPAAGFPRAAVGDYQIRTVAWCRGNRLSRTEVVTVKEKTPRRTISRAEFDQIRRGMTRERVREIVGYDGEFAGRYRGTFRTYDMMAFWAWASVLYRDGRVARKYWDVDHD